MAWRQPEVRMITNFELAGLGEADLHYALCVANLDGAQRLCNDMIDGTFPASFSHASVVMSLLHHAIELFLKYGISRSDKKVPAHHYIRGLLKEYKAAYPDERFGLELPFITQFLGHTEGDIEKNILAEQRDRNRTDQMGRYHLDRFGKPWEGIHGFIPTSFLEDTKSLVFRLATVRAEIEKIHGRPAG